VEFRLSDHVVFFGGTHLSIYHDLTGAAVRVNGGTRKALLPHVPELAAWPDDGDREPADRAFERLLRWRFLVPQDLDEPAEIEGWFPARSVWSAFYVREDNAVLRARQDRATGRTVLEPLEGIEAALWLACDGSRAYGELLQAAGGEAGKVRDLMAAWTRWDHQLLKWLPRPLSAFQTEGLPSEFVQHLKDEVVHGRRPSPKLAPEGDGVTGFPPSLLPNLYCVPHPALGGRTYGGALGETLLARGLLGRAGGRIVEVGAGTGAVASGLLGMLERDHPAVAAGTTYTIIERAPAIAAVQRSTVAAIPGHVKDRIAWVSGDGDGLPFATRAADLVLATGALAPADETDVVRSGERAVRFLEELARILTPGGHAVLTEFADPPAKLLEAAMGVGLEHQVESAGEALPFDKSTPLLFADHIHMAELAAIANSAGRELPLLAYTKDMLAQQLDGALNLDRLAHLSFAQLGNLAPLGLSPYSYRVVTLRKAE
jgi:SAM-dependent methyltransferase